MFRDTVRKIPRAQKTLWKGVENIFVNGIRAVVIDWDCN